MKARAVSVIPVHDSVEPQAFQLAYSLRAQGLTVEIGFSGNMSKRMKRASNQGCWAAIFVGPEELSKGEVQVKLLDSGEQKTVAIKDLASHLLKAAP
jgi:histidyl-tRNA synthetase